jgi:hypothetical protein
MGEESHGTEGFLETVGHNLRRAKIEMQRRSARDAYDDGIRFFHDGGLAPDEFLRLQMMRNMATIPAAPAGRRRTASVFDAGNHSLIMRRV